MDQLAAAAARSANVSLLRLGGKSGALLPTNGTFDRGLRSSGRLCCDASDLCGSTNMCHICRRSAVAASRAREAQPHGKRRASALLTCELLLLRLSDCDCWLPEASAAICAMGLPRALQTFTRPIVPLQLAADLARKTARRHLRPLYAAKSHLAVRMALAGVQLTMGACCDC